MKTSKMTINQIKNKVLPVLREESVKKASVFGSYVTGEAREDSDVDILVELPNNKSLIDFINLQLKLEKSLGKKVDLVEFSSIKPSLKAQILNNKVQIL
ncbi:MAG TPA: nucleotidyltransferase family protein [Patescibacteria group bacterium]